MKGLSAALDKYRKLETVKMSVGIMEDKTYPDGTPVATVGLLNDLGTETIPARPFFRHAVSNGSGDAKKIIAGAIIAGKDPVTAMRLGGEYMADELKESVMTWTDPPNAPSTIANKGYNAPLRGNDRILRNSFTVEIEE